MGDQDYNDNTAEDVYPVAECRACLQILYSESNLWNIFEPWTPPWDGMENTIAEDLVKLANIQISETDKHSKVICETCYQVLLGACHFTTCVRRNDHILLERYPCEPQLNLDDKDWPKPIQVDKTIHNLILQNPMDVEVKQEVLSDDEYGITNGTYDENKDDIPNLDIKIEPEEIQQSIQVKFNGIDTDSEYESDAPGPSTKKKLRTENVHKKCATKYSRQHFKYSETQSTDNELRRGSLLQVIGDVLIEHDNNENPAKDHVKTPRQIVGVRLKKTPKTSAERAREFRARKSLLKQQSKQQSEQNATVEITSEDNEISGTSETRTIDKRAKSAEATRRWRDKQGVSESSKKQAKTAAQRMREYRKRKKLAKKNTVEAAK